MNFLLGILLSVVVSAQVDSTTLFIGDQTTLHLSATVSEGEQVALPLIDRQVTDGIEVVDRTKIDTIREKDGRISYKQDLTLTSFKDSLFYVEPLNFVVGGDTIKSNSFSINVVQPFDLAAMDSTEAITDIKPVMRAKVWWWGIIRWILLALLLAGLAAGAYFLHRWWLRHMAAKEEKIDPELLRPCDEVALEKLDKIKEEKAWQTGEHKRYFSELTYVIREYIGRRYDVRSTEKTSDDTLAAMKPILTEQDQKELYQKLEKMLRLADLVKFAKWQPTPDENELSLMAAYTFVKETKPTEEEKGQQGEVENADFEKVE